MLQSKLLDAPQALSARRETLERGQTLVFTNGCFDILHAGHLNYLSQARGLGDFLWVGLNSDASVRRLKGPRRPINNEADRALMLSGLAVVDAVILFDEDDPLRLILSLKPDILVKGGDWPPEKIVGGRETLARGGKVLSLPLTPGQSTTNLIQKILETYAPFAK
ncbi:MAG: D-glycero-beta-D-manno-heptose 1-phosphate adenylyltransferase [Deltaproteobacteria bacterium]|jgi:rfaE bifunctional protein nucleotidyltransferase chain/domain|nr:D-glycero-beta-D-manno-heptose 1-phosphate adenylyltransferase [Deltaproteobacteria bacterium]